MKSKIRDQQKQQQTIFLILKEMEMVAMNRFTTTAMHERTTFMDVC